MALTIASFTGILKSDEEMLVEIQNAILAVQQTGQAYTLFGSRTVTHGDLSTLMRLENVYRSRVLLANGYNGRNTAQTVDNEDNVE